MMTHPDGPMETIDLALADAAADALPGDVPSADDLAAYDCVDGASCTTDACDDCDDDCACTDCRAEPGDCDGAHDCGAVDAYEEKRRAYLDAVQVAERTAGYVYPVVREDGAEKKRGASGVMRRGSTLLRPRRDRCDGTPVTLSTTYGAINRPLAGIASSATSARAEVGELRQLVTFYIDPRDDDVSDEDARRAVELADMLAFRLEAIFGAGERLADALDASTGRVPGADVSVATDERGGTYIPRIVLEQIDGHLADASRDLADAAGATPGDLLRISAARACVRTARLRLYPGELPLEERSGEHPPATPTDTDAA